MKKKKRKKEREREGRRRGIGRGEERMSVKNGRCTFRRAEKRYDAEIRPTPNPVLKTRSRMTVTNSTPTDSLWRWPLSPCNVCASRHYLTQPVSKSFSPCGVGSGRSPVSRSNLARSSFSRSLIGRIIFGRRSNLKGERSIRRHDIGRPFFNGALLFAPLLIFLCASGRI